MGLTQQELDERFNESEKYKFVPTLYTDIDGNEYNVTATEIDGIKTLTFTSVKTLDETIYENLKGMWEII